MDDQRHQQDFDKYKSDISNQVDEYMVRISKDQIVQKIEKDRQHEQRCSQQDLPIQSFHKFTSVIYKKVQHAAQNYNLSQNKVSGKA